MSPPNLLHRRLFILFIAISTAVCDFRVDANQDLERSMNANLVKECCRHGHRRWPANNGRGDECSGVKCNLEGAERRTPISEDEPEEANELDEEPDSITPKTMESEDENYPTEEHLTISKDELIDEEESEEEEDGEDDEGLAIVDRRSPSTIKSEDISTTSPTMPEDILESLTIRSHDDIFDKTLRSGRSPQGFDTRADGGDKRGQDEEEEEDEDEEDEDEDEEDEEDCIPHRKRRPNRGSKHEEESSNETKDKEESGHDSTKSGKTKDTGKPKVTGKPKGTGKPKDTGKHKDTGKPKDSGKPKGTGKAMGNHVRKGGKGSFGKDHGTNHQHESPKAKHKHGVKGKKGKHRNLSNEVGRDGRQNARGKQGRTRCVDREDKSYRGKRVRSEFGNEEEITLRSRARPRDESYTTYRDTSDHTTDEQEDGDTSDSGRPSDVLLDKHQSKNEEASASSPSETGNSGTSSNLANAKITTTTVGKMSRAIFYGFLAAVIASAGTAFLVYHRKEQRIRQGQALAGLNAVQSEYVRA